MTAQDIVAFLGAFGIFLAILGSGGRWVISQIAANTLASEAREQSARDELSARMREEIDGLRAELAKVLAEKSLYLRRIYQLEHYIHRQPGMTIPEMSDWPPAS